MPLTMHKMASFIIIMTLLGVTGCQTYQPHPLTPTAVDDAVSSPDLKTLSAQAKTLTHPLLPPLTIDINDGLSPDEAAVIAILANPILRAIRDRRALADAQLLQAGLLPSPQLSASLEPVTGGVTADTFTGYSYGVSWDLNALITRRAKLDSVQASRSAVELDVAWSSCWRRP